MEFDNKVYPSSTEETPTVITQEPTLPEFQILKGIVMPVKNQGRTSKYPFDKMEIGDSFFTTLPMSTVAGSISWYKKQNPGTAFKSKAWGKGRMVWRIA